MRNPATALLLAGVMGIASAGRAARAEEIRPTFEGLERREDPGKTQALNALGVVHMESSSSGLFATTDVWWRPVRGVYRYPMTYDRFYLTLGRKDLADRFTARYTTGEVMIWTGFAAMIGGLLGGSYALFKDNTTGAWIGGGALLAGFVSIRIGGRLQRPLHSEEEAEEMAGRYNRALEAHLGAAHASGGRPGL